MPFFNYHLLDKENVNHVWLTDGAVQLCRGEDIHALYELFGYTNEMRINQVEPEYYIWENYIKESAPKEQLCLQAIIITYLNDNSEKFREDYSEAYENWLGTCNSNKLRETEDCLNCKMRKRVEPTFMLG